MRKTFSLLLVCLLVVVSASAQKKDDILGKWLNSSGEGQIDIYKKGDRFFGKLSWIKVPNDDKGKPKLDVKNPVASLRSKSILGLEILKDFVFEEGKWVDGSIYDPQTGKTYSCTISLKSNGQLNMRGYIGISLIGRTEVWKRAK